MIKCKDTSGKILDDSFRYENTNALIFSQNNKYRQYMKDKENKDKIIWMENKISELTAMVCSLIKKTY